MLEFIQAYFWFSKNINCRYFLVRKFPIELPDTLFMKNLIMFKKWLYIEEIPEERRKAQNAFVKCVKPKKTIW